jgi:thermitase
MSMSHRKYVPATVLASALLLAACGVSPTGLRPVAGKIVEGKSFVGVRSVPMPPEVIAATEGDRPLVVPGAKELDKFSFRGLTYHLLGVSNKGLINNVVSALRATGGVRTADANPPVVAMDAPLPDDEYYGLQYSHHQKQLHEAWAVTQGDPELIVAVVDTGVDFNHPDLKGRVINGPDFLFRPGWIFNRKDKNGPMDDNGHGTHCAGIIAASANNGLGMAGVAPKVKIMAVKSLDHLAGGTQYDVMRGIAHAAMNGAKIVNLSHGGMGTTSVERKFYSDAVQNGLLLVSSAGNNGDALTFPAAYPGVLSVGATDSGGALWKGSNHDLTLGVTAPGVGILSTVPDNAYEKQTGTSAAAAFASGVAALVWSAHPDWSAQDVIDRIEQTADDKGAPGVDAQFGHGEINVLAALKEGKRR